MATKGMVKVVFPLDPGAWHGSLTESLWATPTGEGRYRLENTPFYALGVSYMDTVTAREDHGSWVFTGVATRGGHSTYRVIPRATLEIVTTHWAPLHAAGCTYEEGARGLRAVDVPPQSDVSEVYRLLEAGEAAGVWYFEEGHCGHPVA